MFFSCVFVGAQLPHARALTSCRHLDDVASFAAALTACLRGVSKDWKSGGVTTVNRNFIRLTPDRQVRIPPVAAAVPPRLQELFRSRPDTVRTMCLPVPPVW